MTVSLCNDRSSITTEILSEYEEVIGFKLSPQTAASVIRTLIELENVIPTTVYFKYQLIRQAPDDDKFANCAIAANTDFIVTHDKHFDILKTIDFPKIKTNNSSRTVKGFIKILKNNYPFCCFDSLSFLSNHRSEIPGFWKIVNASLKADHFPHPHR